MSLAVPLGGVGALAASPDPWESLEPGELRPALGEAYVQYGAAEMFVGLRLHKFEWFSDEQWELVAAPTKLIRGQAQPNGHRHMVAPVAEGEAARDLPVPLDAFDQSQ